MEPIGFAMSSVDYAIQIASHLKHTVEAYHQNPSDCAALLTRFHAVRKSLSNLKHSKHLDLRSQIWGSAFSRIRAHFDRASEELEDIRSTLKSKSLWKFIHAADISKRIRALEDDVDTLQRDLDLLGFFTASGAASATQASITLSHLHDVQSSIQAMEHRLNSIAAKLPDGNKRHRAKDKSTRSRAIVERAAEVPQSLPPTESASENPCGSIGTTTTNMLLERVRQIERTLKEFSKMSQRVDLRNGQNDFICNTLQSLREKWQIDLQDISISYSTDSRDSSEASVFQGSVTLRDIYGNVARVAHAAVKVVQNDTQAEEEKLAFLHQVFVLREVSHPCLLTFYGAYWGKGLKDNISGVKSKLSIGTDQSAIIVTEWMTHNLLSAKREGHLDGWTSKLKVLTDIAAAVEFLHSKGLSHKRLKPENILLRIVDGTIMGHVKLGDVGNFGAALQACSDSENITSPPFKTEQSYLPPEAQYSRDNYCPSWDVWSFGSIMCFLSDTGVKSAGSSREERRLEKGLPNSAGIRPGEIVNLRLRDLAKQCLSPLDESRPSLTMVRRTLESVCEELFQTAVAVVDNGDKLRTTGKEHLFGRNGQGGDPLEAFKFFHEAVQKGNIPSLVSLGDCFFYAHGAERNWERAIELYKLAANAGHPSGLFRLGECYYDGTGIAQNVPKAVACFKKAAEKSNIPAKFRLGSHYLEEKNPEGLALAIKLWKEAANAGHPIAQFRFAKCLEDGVGVARDVLLARMWYSKSAANGHMGAKWAIDRLDAEVKIHRCA